MFNSKRFIPVLILLLSTTSLVATAEPQGKGKHKARGDRHHGNPEMKVERIFRTLDIDENGVITVDEFLAKPLRKAERQYNRIDADDDGLISLEEFLAVHNDRNDRRRDRREDLEIDVDELKACIAERLGTEIPERPDRETAFSQIDTNADGFVDLGEFVTAKTNSASDKFDRIDTNADGGITPEELIASMESHKERREIKRACIEEQQDLDELLDE